MTLDVAVTVDGAPVWRSWALNDAAVEKASRERMLEVIAEVDGRPLSRWGCDGVVFATPTGSTAYAFSAGGPVVWPEVEALLMVPLSAHALFARPLVVSPRSVLAIEVMSHTEGVGVVFCDGRRTAELPPGARIEVRRGAEPVRLARLLRAPFTDRLVAKFQLPVRGWRGRDRLRRARGGRARAARRRRVGRVLEEMRIRGLGVIEDALLELGPGLTVLTGETGAGKTMVVTGLGLLFGGRADAGAVRPGSRAVIEGRVRVDPAGPVAASGARSAGAELDQDGLLVARTRVCRGSVAGTSGRPLGPGRAARRARRGPGGGARPGRPAEPASARPPAGGARPVRRARARGDRRRPTPPPSPGFVRWSPPCRRS